MNFLPPPAALGGTEMGIGGTGDTTNDAGIGVVTSVWKEALADKFNVAFALLFCCTFLFVSIARFRIFCSESRIIPRT